MIAIATDTVDADELRRPRTYNVKEVVLVSIILGVVSTVFDFIFFSLFYQHNPGILQTNWFIGSVVTELALIFSIRSRFFFLRAKRAAVSLIGLSAVALFAAVALPFTGFGQKIFGFIRPSGRHLLLIGGIVLVYFIATESIKILYYRMTNGRSLKQLAIKSE